MAHIIPSAYKRPNNPGSGEVTVAVHTSLGSCDSFDFSQFRGGALTVTGSGITSLAVYNSLDGVTWHPHKADGSAVTIAAAPGESHELPAGMFGCSNVKLLATGGTGSATLDLKG